MLARILDRYPELPPAPTGPAARVALIIVAVLSLAFVLYFSLYLSALHDAYLTSGEDLGIMDQALWNTVHGALLHQTICNVVSDTNCLGDVSRLAIHFEPILLPISLLYLIVPSPKTLIVVQALVVAAGAFPAYWIASRRLQSLPAGVAFAIVYLLYPSLTSAILFPFHAVTLSAAFLMFALYFMLTRNTVGLFISCLLALATKEEVPADIILIGLSILFLQRRWRVGAGLLVLSTAWIGLYLIVTRAVSPLGHAALSNRYDYLGNSPFQILVNILTHPLTILRERVFSTSGILYLRSSLSGVAYLPLFSPLTLLIAAPVMALNLLSTQGAMRLGLFHYNAEIVPVFILAAIESVALFAAVGEKLARHLLPAVRKSRLGGMASRVERLPDTVESLVARLPWRVSASNPLTRTPSTTPATRPVGRVIVLALTLLSLLFCFYEQRMYGHLPISHAWGSWPKQSAHTQVADKLVSLIPPDAVVCTQSFLLPHLSQRRYIYQYPYRAMESDYVLLDLSEPLYPFHDKASYDQSVESLLRSGAFSLMAAESSYLLLTRNKEGTGPPIDPYSLPPSFQKLLGLPSSP